MNVRAIALVVLLLTASVANPLSSPATGNEQPLAEAGLDQEVDKGTTVFLDATESRDPDGSIDTHEWTIQTPDGDTVTPDCQDCPRTQFVASQVGTYEVTVTVTDDDGAASSDTLYVVVTPGSGPELSLAGPTEPSAGVSVTYSASIEAGTADLDRVQWYVDGDHVTTHSVSGQGATDTLTRTFPSAADHTITAEVYDEDEQRAAESISIQVESSNDTGDDGDSPSLSSRGKPTISGPKTVLGERPLEGTYTVSLDLDSGKVAGIEWYAMGDAFGGGTTESVTWTPGDHQLFAVVTYVDGSTNVARFPDGSTTVVADPKPSVSFGSLSTIGEISGIVRADDEYGNLQSLTVSVDGEVVEERTVDERQLRKRGGAGRLSTSFAYRDIVPGEPHTVRLVATDVRGQTTELTRNVTPDGEPEIVRSEFVNDPVDSYHERIDASRYAAHHVLEIDLNGVDPNNLEIVLDPVTTAEMRKLDSAEYHTTIENVSGGVTVHSYWIADEPGEYIIESGWSTKNDETSSRIRSTFQATPSRPELRYKVVDTGRVDDSKNWGLIVDASDSFDPDGTDISYVWKYGANPISPDNSTAKFDSFERAALTIEDGYELTTTHHGEFLDHYTPGVLTAEEVSEGPYKPNDTVRLRVFTNAYELSKNSYEVDLGLDVAHSSGHVSNWEEVHFDNGDCRTGTCSYQIPLPERLDINNRRYRYHTGIVEIEASAFANGTGNPQIVLYNRKSPDQTSEEFALPETNVLVKGERYWQNVTVEDIEYTVEKPVYDRVVANNESARDEYLADNFSIASKDTAEEYVVEKRVKTQSAEYETERNSFRQRGTMEAFLKANPNWSEAGTDRITKTYTTTETEWRDSRDGTGTFTGNTRDVLVVPAQYKAERQYRYEYQVEKTGTRTVSRTKYRWVQKTGTRTVTKCSWGLGCYETTETYTYTTKEAYTYTTTETYTYYVTETATYWATGRHHPDHEFTGKSRTIKIKPAEYKTQYEYQYEVEHTKTVYRHIAEREVEVQPAQYEWQEYEVISDKLAAQTMAERGTDWRVGDHRTSPVWTLKKRKGTEIRIVDTYDEFGDVIETNAKISGIVVQKYLNIESGETIYGTIGSREDTFTDDIAMTKDDVVEFLERTKSKGNSGVKWCSIKGVCDK